MNAVNPNPGRYLSGWTIVLIIALAASVAQAFGRFTYGVLLPAVRDDLAMTNTQAGLIGAVNVGAYLLGTMMVAWATSRYRLLNVMKLGLILATSGLLLAGNASSPLALALALFITGIGGSFVWIPAPVVAADALPPGRRSMAVGLVGSGIGAGIVFASVLSGALRSSSGDNAWSSIYQIQSGIGLVIVICTLVFVRHQQEVPAGGAGIGGFGALRRMPGWLPLIVAYSTFGFMYLLVMGFLTTRLEDDSLWASSDAAFAFTTMGFAMIVGGPTLVAVSHLLGVRIALAIAFCLWPVFVCIVLTGLYVPTLAACIGLGILFNGLPILMTIYVVDNTTPGDYGPSFAAATLAFGVAQTASPAIGGAVADLSGSFTLVFLISAFMGIVGFVSSLQLPGRNRSDKHASA